MRGFAPRGTGGRSGLREMHHLEVGNNQSFDPPRWSHGITAMSERLTKLGLLELAANVVRELPTA